MRKKFLVVVIGTIFAAPLTVQAEGIYVSLGLGKAKTSTDVNNSLITTVSRSNGLAVNLEAGYAFTRNFGIELGYVNLGKSKDTISTSEVFTYRFTSYFLAGTGTVPIGPFSLFAKLGAANNRIAATDTVGSTSTTFDGGRLSLMSGIGASLDVTKNIGMRVQYENFGKVSSASSSTVVNDLKGKGQMWSIGLLYKF